MRKLNLEDLINGKITGLSKNVSAFLFEALIVTLFLNQHKSGVKLKIEGSFQETFEVIWKTQPSSNILNNWIDQKETVEYASTGIAFLLLDKLTDYHFFARAAQDDAADYLLNSKATTNKFEDGNPLAYLEVSGIWEEKKGNTLNVRFNLKKRNLEKQNVVNLPTFIIVAEFSVPKAKIGKYG